MSDLGEVITFVLPGLGTSGGYRTLGEWATRLARTSHVVVVSPLDGPGRAYFGSEVEIRLPRRVVHRTADYVVNKVRNRTGPLVELMTLPHLARPLIPKRGRVIACYLPWMPGLGPDGRFTAYCQHWESVFSLGHPRAHRRAEAAMNWPGPLIVNSSWLQSKFHRSSPPPLVFPGVNTEVYCPGEARQSRGELPRVVALGRTDVEWKGTADLLAAVTQVGFPVELVLFGTAEIAVQERPWGVLRQVGTVTTEKLAELYRSADVVACPSWFESFPLPPLEAMACGTPVVTTRLGTEDYAADRRNALVVEAQQPERLAAALGELLTDQELRATLGREGLTTAREFTWERGYQMFLRALEQTADS